ncbi:putative disease resistance RPP13-like protein 1 [Corylus avellana]|uniref:putative disease resistance RPP13-like protein 1 n=1 Tax=Corylus avellana TaxID=13451 RepID=UPI00286B91A6|nr:putative disease resistance RPP13-like protein 1 [Corylus avellana]
MCKVWLDMLKEAVYDAEVILDEIATEVLVQKQDAMDDADDILKENATKENTHKLKAKVGASVSKVRNLISTCFVNNIVKGESTCFVNNVNKEIEKLVDRLEALVKHKENIGLKEVNEGNSSERLATTSVIDESRSFAWHDDKDAIIYILLSNGANGDEMGVIAIVGMGGIGKITTAQLVYNDNMVNEHFDLKVWVCVSDPFNVSTVMKIIRETVDSSANVGSKNLNQLQNELMGKLTGKKFLRVLDDVWEKNNAKWEVLSNALKSGAQEKCEAIGRQILEKCKGLPLAIKAIGTVLRSKSGVDEWDRVLRSELWDLLKTGILPALRLSYKHLLPKLKRCFAYCSIFPNDYAFKKDKLVLLWMAEGFLQQYKNKTMEEVGDDYFLALVSRSLFQKSYDNKYIMHDLVSDLATFISKQFTVSLADDCPTEIVSNTRHLSFHKNFARF